MKKAFNLIILVIFLGSVAILTAQAQIHIVTNVCLLLIGMLIGAAIKSEEGPIEMWSRKKLKDKT